MKSAESTGEAGASGAARGESASAEAWWMVVVLFFFYVISMLDRTIIAMMVEPIKADLGLDDFQMSLVYGPAFALFYAVAGFPFGWAADQFARRHVILVGIVIWSIATLACGFVGTFFALFVARAFVGAGEASLTPSSYSLISDKFPKERLTTALSFYAAGPKFGHAIAFAAGGFLIAGLTRLHAEGGLGIGFLAETAPWRLIFIMLGVFCVLASGLVFSFGEPARKGKSRGERGARSGSATLIGFMRKYPLLIACMAVSFAALGMCSGALVMWVPSYMTRSFGWTPLQYGPVLGIVSTLGALSLVAKGVIIDWLYARGVRDAHIRFYTWLLIGFSPLMVAAFLVPNVWMFIGMYGILQVLVLPFMLYLSATIQMVAPNDIRGRLSAFFLFVVSTLALGIGPPIVGFLTEYVFKDPMKLGVSLACVSTFTVIVSLIGLRLALRELKAPLDAMQALAAPEEPQRR